MGMLRHVSWVVLDSVTLTINISRRVAHRNKAGGQKSIISALSLLCSDYGENQQWSQSLPHCLYHATVIIPVRKMIGKKPAYEKLKDRLLA